MQDERRTAKRHTLWIPVHVAAGDDVKILAVSRNISWSGALMIAATTLEVGEKVGLTLQVPGTEDRELTGTIVRVEPNKDDPDGLWKTLLAVAFDEDVHELEEAFERLSAAAR